MAKINVLTSDIYNLISAGEVVVSPASLVKELIENSIDAEAHNIRIEIVNGGISQIIVKDDGLGIERSEVEKAFIKHATSKIATKEDIYNIRTMGFRGEALYSIALVSNLNMTTRNRCEDTGTRIELEGGKIISKEEVATEFGTTIEVTKLFFNTPARYKFLKSATKEFKEIQTLVSNFILSHPEIEFELIVDGQTKTHNKKGNLENAIFAVYGSEFVTNMIKVNEKYMAYRLEGAISLPTISKSNHSWQTVFVNNRLVECEEVSAVVNTVYSEFLMRGRFPCFVLNLIIPYDEVDVNVSPQKTQIKFTNSTKICDWIYHGLREILADVSTQEEVEDMQVVENEKNIDDDFENETQCVGGVSIKDLVENKSAYFEHMSQNSNEVQQKTLITSKQIEIKDFISSIDENEEMEQMNKLNSPTAINTKMLDEIQKLKEDALLTAQMLSNNENLQREENYDERQNSIKSTYQDLSSIKNISHLYSQSSFLNHNNKVVGVLFSTYIIVQNPDEFFIIDQHAVHEKFLFDKFMNEIENSAIATQELMVPFKFNVNAKEKDFILENIKNLESLGVEVQDFGQNSLIITQIPTVLADVSLKDFVSEILSDLTVLTGDKIALKNKIATRACKNAIKAGDTLSESEIDKILEMVETSKTPLLCPHGRPYVVKITKNQVEKWFKRTL